MTKYANKIVNKNIDPPKDKVLEIDDPNKSSINTDYESGNSNNLTFLDKVNSTQKKLGHNKLQMDIEEYKTKLIELESIIKEKDMKINLYKQNVSTLQNEILQLQCKLQNSQQDSTIDDLQIKLSNQSVTIKSLEDDIIQKADENTFLHEEVIRLNKYIHEKDEKHSVLELEVTQCKSSLNKLTDLHDKVASLLGNKEDELQTLRENLQTKIKTIEMFEMQVSELKGELSKHIKVCEDAKMEVVEKNIEIDSIRQRTHVTLESPVSQNVVRGVPRTARPRIVKNRR